MSDELLVDVWFDLICPWCLIGKRNLARALTLFAAEHPDIRVQTNWHGVQLQPQLPAHGVPFSEFYARRLGGDDAVRMRQAQVREAAARAGVEIAFERIAVMPNTARAHHALRIAAQHASAAQFESLLERLFVAYFQRGEDIGDPRQLTDIVAECGLDPERFDLHADAALAPTPQVAVDGVPAFVIDHRFELSGAQPPEVLLAAMRHALATRAQPKAAES